MTAIFSFFTTGSAGSGRAVSGELVGVGTEPEDTASDEKGTGQLVSGGVSGFKGEPELLG